MSVSSRMPIIAPSAPAAVGPYTHAVRHGEALYCSAALPLDPAYGAFFGDGPPARVAVGVAALPRGARVEIDAVVAVD
jgi:enamine deaminase RidA (YjgF/YER057c/UK114 family)